MLDIEKLREDCGQFILAIEKNKKAFGQICIGLTDYPKGSCSDASYFLAIHLDRKGYGVWNFVSGRCPEDGHTHAWIEKDGCIIDITLKQFSEGFKMDFLQDKNSPFYKKYEIEVSKPYDKLPPEWRNYLINYERLKRYMKNS